MKIQRVKYSLVLFIILTITTIPAGSFAQSSYKRGGIGFRIDENPSVQSIRSYDSVFAAYWKNYTFAVTSYVLPLAPSYVDTLRALASRGVELADNTPTHATQFFNVLDIQELNQYLNKPGVDHFTGEKVCLKYSSYDTTNRHGEGYVDLRSNKLISHNNGEFHDLLGPSKYFALFLKAPVNKIVLFYDVQSVNVSDPDTLSMHTFWDETYTSQNYLNFRYHKLMNNNVVMHDSAVKILAQRSLHIFDSMYLARPYTWIQPNGQYPWISPLKLKAVLGDKLNYRESSSNISPALFCYNEFNPKKNKQFSINSEHLSMENGTFKSNSHIIVNAVAKHYVLFDVARLTNAYGGFNAYLQRMDSLLAWCSSFDIPVKTYSQWKSLLYDSIPQKTTEIFPLLNVDLDNDNWPDGFNHDAWISGFYQNYGGYPYNNGFFRTDSAGGYLCAVDSLAGMDKGSNMFTIYAKGQGRAGSHVVVTIQFPEVTGHNMTFSVPSDSTDWKRYSTVVKVPDSASIANFRFQNPVGSTDTVFVSGMSFKSTGFLSLSKYPLQEQTANNLFPNFNLNSLLLDTTTYPPSSIIWTFKGNHSMWFSADSLGIMKSNRPKSFWTGKDSVYALARRPDMLTDSCLFRFKSDTVPQGCAGNTISISILDTITSSDYVRWSSLPHDSTMSDTTIFNPTMSPRQTTKYRVKVYNLLGNIFRDSITIKRYPYPEPGLFHDSTICKGKSVMLTAQGGGTYLWSTGDTTASITVKPDTLTNYKVTVSNKWNCSASDSTLIHVSEVPVVKLSGVMTHYCSTDPCTILSGTPYGGIYGANSGYVPESLFCPNQALPGADTVWYAYTTAAGCFTADTIFTFITPPPLIPKLPDTNLCGNKFIVLRAGPGADNYIWSNGSTDSLTVVDSTGFGLGMLKVWVYVTMNGCVSWDTARINFIDCPTGISDPEKLGNFRVYPNPFDDYITLIFNDLPGPGDKAELINTGGDVILSAAIMNKQTIIPAKGIPSGIYFLHLIHGSGQYFMKLIRN